MNDRRKFLLGLGAWVGGVTALHGWLNVRWDEVLNNWLPLDKRKLNVAYIPVT